jgi:hypothetical protein
VLRRKTDDLQMACGGRFTDSHAQMCRPHLDDYDHLTGKIAELYALVAEAAAPTLAARGWAIEDGRTKVAEVSMKWFRVADTYGVQVAPGQDPVVILAVTAVLDTMAHPGR